MKEYEGASHSITLIERKSFITNGVKKIENFDDKEFLIDTLMGYLLVKGNDLELIKLDTNSGNISIKGLINSITYLDDNNKEKDSLITKLFK